VPADAVTAGFCERCLAESQDESPTSVRDFNGFGRSFLGGKSDCATCGSKIRTLWVLFVAFPVVPVGSYRYKQLSSTAGFTGSRGTFVARRMTTQWDQVVRTWAAAIVIAAVLIPLFMFIDKLRGR